MVPGCEKTYNRLCVRFLAHRVKSLLLGSQPTQHKVGHGDRALHDMANDVQVRNHRQPTSYTRLALRVAHVHLDALPLKAQTRERHLLLGGDIHTNVFRLLKCSEYIESATV